MRSMLNTKGLFFESKLKGFGKTVFFDNTERTTLHWDLPMVINDDVALKRNRIAYSHNFQTVDHIKPMLRNRSPKATKKETRKIA